MALVGYPRQALEEEVRKLGGAQARAELTEKAESTLREQLERERQRADQEWERADRLEAELRESRRGLVAEAIRRMRRSWLHGFFFGP